MRDFGVVGVSHTGITVSDMAKSLHFYREILGFESSNPIHAAGPGIAQFVGVPGAEIDISIVRAPGYMLELLCYTKPDDRILSTLRPCDTGNLHLCFKVTNIEKVVEAMGVAGYEAIGQIQTVEHGPGAGARAVYTRDPDGVHIEVIEDSPGFIFEDVFFGVTSEAART